MKRTLVLVMAVVLACLLLSGCCMEHEWAEATCTEPKTCVKCGETEGEAAGHEWEDATCTEAKTCSICGETEGKALGHEWEDATCTEAKTCSVCGETEGKALGHEWEDATCTEAKTCSVCGETKGKPNGHSVEEWVVELEPTCAEVGTQSGVCTVCNETVTEDIPLLDHTPGEWEVETLATEYSDGERVQYCTECGAEVAREFFSLTPEEIEEQYKAQCEYYYYSDISRNPGSYDGYYAWFTGEVIQVQQQELLGRLYYVLRVNVTKGKYSYSDTVYVSYDADIDDPRILEDDIITMYGKLTGEKTYTTVMGNSITIPSFSAEYIDIY